MKQCNVPLKQMKKMNLKFKCIYLLGRNKNCGTIFLALRFRMIRVFQNLQEIVIQYFCFTLPTTLDKTPCLSLRYKWIKLDLKVGKKIPKLTFGELQQKGTSCSPSFIKIMQMRSTYEPNTNVICEVGLPLLRLQLKLCVLVRRLILKGFSVLKPHLHF